MEDNGYSVKDRGFIFNIVYRSLLFRSSFCFFPLVTRRWCRWWLLSIDLSMKQKRNMQTMSMPSIDSHIQITVSIFDCTGSGSRCSGKLKICICKLMHVSLVNYILRYWSAESNSTKSHICCNLICTRFVMSTIIV